MEILTKAARISYGIMVAGLAIQQIFYATFRTVILPPWQLSFPGSGICVYLVSAAIIICALAIIFDKKAKNAALILGGALLVLFVFFQLPYEIFAAPNNTNLGNWTSILKELAISGGAFVLAGSYNIVNEKKHAIISMLEKLIPFGSVFFGIMLIIFGIDHFLYHEWIGTLVPNWIPAHIFWAYFAGVALIGSGVAFIARIKIKLAGILCAIMIFVWFIILHIPRAIVDPYSLQGNEVSSVLESFGFSGIAYLIAYGHYKRKTV